MAKIIKLRDLLIEQPPKSIKKKPANSTGNGDTIKKLKIDIPDTPFEPDVQQIKDRLKHILKKWEDNVYPNDRVRWNDYYHDIEKLIKTLEGDK